MGSIPSPPAEYGNDCSVCNPTPWPSGYTPKYLRCLFTGIIKCVTVPPWPSNPPAPNGIIFLLTQWIYSPCVWDFYDGTWNIIYQASSIFPNHSSLELIYFPSSSWYFRSLETPSCKFSFSNQELCSPPDPPLSGIGVIF